MVPVKCKVLILNYWFVASVSTEEKCGATMLTVVDSLVVVVLDLPSVAVWV